MMVRDQRLEGVVAPRRAEHARLEASSFVAFCSRLDLDETAESVTLYLTSLLDQGLPVRRIRERLQLLDLDRRLRGLVAWHQDPDVRTFLRGLFANRPVGANRGHYDPLYLELVHAMVDACRAPSDDQRRALAARILRERLELTTATMARLRWSDVRLGKHRTEVDVTTKVGRGTATASTHFLNARVGHPDCPVAAIRALRPLGGGEFILGSNGKPESPWV